MSTLYELELRVEKLENKIKQLETKNSDKEPLTNDQKLRIAEMVYRR